MDQPDLFVPTAQELADQGMARAVEHADAVEDGWSERAYAYLLYFARTNYEFMAEEVRTAAHQEGLPLPPDGRAWGAVIVRGTADKIITSSGTYRKTRIPPAHSTPRTVWRSNVYGQREAA